MEFVFNKHRKCRLQNADLRPYRSYSRCDYVDRLHARARAREGSARMSLNLYLCNYLAAINVEASSLFSWRALLTTSCAPQLDEPLYPSRMIPVPRVSTDAQTHSPLTTLVETREWIPLEESNGALGFCGMTWPKH